MDDIKEKLMEVLRVPIYPHELADPTEVVADYLLDNDVVPVVRCEKCMHCELYYPEKQIGKATTAWWYCKMHECYHAKDYFCSYGERKDNEKE